MNVHQFPEQPDRRPALSHPHPAVQREAARITAWAEFCQRALSRLPGAEPEHHRRLRAIADELLERLVD